MKKSKILQVQNLHQLSAQVAVCPSLIQSEKKKSDSYTLEELLKVGLVVFDCICKETLSKDLLYLAFARAEQILEKVIDDKKRLKLMLKKYAELAEKERQSNTLSKMF